MPLSPSEFFKELINTPDINKMSPEQRKKNIWMIKRKNSEKNVQKHGKYKIL